MEIEIDMDGSLLPNTPSSSTATKRTRDTRSRPRVSNTISPNTESTKKAGSSKVLR